MNARPWRSSCATSECVEWRPTGEGTWEVRSKARTLDCALLSLEELSQVAQAYLDGEFGPVKVSRL